MAAATLTLTVTVTPTPTPTHLYLDGDSSLSRRRRRALEELRSSLYNELKTSEEAKRQQQRFCGPVVAMSFNFIVDVGIILANKLVMGRVGFNFPIFLTLIHYSRLDSSSFLQVPLFASIKDNTFLLSLLSRSCHGLCFWTR
ncbi:hypothetical protein CARUB_v10021546mg [Capsella rubella]|uniref:Uncharacterized protein n=1 Tax=Capsella rubella TaxID=81985 RepID=R0GE49_9BRAS|nr:uncharacterized protein LOC17896077 [Capsella rubella]EOA34047.1 hypothetical protein CARUB_v10021546mg [Capsella rubella]